MSWNQPNASGAGGGGGGGSGDVTGVTGSAPISVSSSGGPVPNVSISAATGLAAGSMSAAHYSKLEGIEAGADVTDEANVRAALAGALSGIDVNGVQIQNMQDGGPGCATTYEQVRIGEPTATGTTFAAAGSLTIGQTFGLGGILSPSQITSNQTDYGPTGYGNASIFRLSTDASRTINSLFAPTASTRRYIQICNVGSNDLVLKHDDGATGTAAQRILCPGSVDLTIKANGSVSLVYDTTSSRWRVLQSRAMVGGSTNQVQYNSGGALAGAANVEIQSDRLLFVQETSRPSGVSGRNVLSFYQRAASHVASPIVTPLAADHGDWLELQQRIVSRKYMSLSAGGGTTLTTLGFAVGTQGTNTISHTVPASTSYTTRQRRFISTGGTGANVSTGFYSTVAAFWRGDAAGRGGLRYRIKNLHWTAWQSGMRAFHGIVGLTSALSSSSEPSTTTDCFGIGYDSTDSVLQFMHNDGSGNCTKVDLNTLTGTTDWNLSTTLIVDVEIMAKPNGGDVFFVVSYSDPASGVTPAASSVSSNLPGTTTFLGFRDYAANGATGVAAVITRTSVECVELAGG